MRISDEEKQAVRKAMLTDLDLLIEESSEAMIDMDRIMIPEGTQLHKVWVAVKGEVESLTAALEAMKEEKCRWQREANSLKRMSGCRINTMKAERGLRREKIATLKKELAASEASKDTIRVLKQDLQGTTALKTRFKKRMGIYKKSADENTRLVELFRSHLDDSAQDAENDNEWEEEARQILCTDEDVEQRIQAEGYKP